MYQYKVERLIANGEYSSFKLEEKIQETLDEYSKAGWRLSSTMGILVPESYDFEGCYLFFEKKTV